VDIVKGINRVGLIIGIGGLSYGLYTYYKKQIFWASQYCYKIANVDLISFTFESIKFYITLKILNRSMFGVVIKSYDLDIFIDNNYITNIKSDVENIINPNTSSFIKSLVDIKPSNVLKTSNVLELASKYLSDRSKIIVTVKGNLTAKSSILRKTIPINFTENLENLITSDKSSNEKLVCPKDF
jgi:LEA14-like dessication related protein